MLNGLRARNGPGSQTSAPSSNCRSLNQGSSRECGNATTIYIYQSVKDNPNFVFHQYPDKEYLIFGRPPSSLYRTRLVWPTLQTPPAPGRWPTSRVLTTTCASSCIPLESVYVDHALSFKCISFHSLAFCLVAYTDSQLLKTCT
jgi:hypothetical protein